jgi:hypothetical protein
MIIEIGEKEFKLIDGWSQMTSDEIAHVLTFLEARVPFSDIEMALQFQDVTLLKLFNKDLVAEITEVFFDELERMDYLIQIAKSFVDQFALSNKDSRKLIHNLYINPLPWVKLKDEKGTIRKYYAPYCSEEQPFRDCTFIEIARILFLYQNYREENNEQYLNDMIAILYREAKPRNERMNDDQDDPRMKLEDSEKLLSRRSKLVEQQFPKGLKSMICLHVVSAFEAFSSQYSDLYDGKKNKGGGDMIDFVFEICDFDISKKDAVLNMNCHEVYEFASRLIAKRAKTAKG